jgi:hypothetical protein
VHVAEALGRAAEGSYEQEAAVVEEDEEIEREDERGVAKRPDLDELDVVGGWRRRPHGRAAKPACAG